MMFHILTFISLLLGLADAASVPKPASLTALEPDLNLNRRPLLSTNGTYLGDLNETFRFTIPDTTLTLFLTPYGDRLTEEDIVACLQDAGSFIIRQITLRGNRQMPRRTWRVNNAALEALPGPYMSLAMGLEVVGALEDIVIERDWTFATQVLVVDTRFGGIGSLRIAYWWTPNAGTEDHRTGRRNLWEGKRKNLEA